MRKFLIVWVAALGAVLGYSFGPGACLGAVVGLAILVLLKPRAAEGEAEEITVPEGSFPHACPSCRRIIVFHRHDDGHACVSHWGPPCSWYARTDVTAEEVAARVDRPGERGMLDKRVPTN